MDNAGLSLVETSENNANSRDEKSTPMVCGPFHPRCGGGDSDRERFEAVGESDRMTLKFRKP
jgi:predicted methyltransferase